MRAVTGG